MEVEKEGRKKEKEKSGREERQVGLKAGVKKKKKLEWFRMRSGAPQKDGSHRH